MKKFIVIAVCIFTIPFFVLGVVHSEKIFELFSDTSDNTENLSNMPSEIASIDLTDPNLYVYKTDVSLYDQMLSVMEQDFINNDFNNMIFNYEYIKDAYNLSDYQADYLASLVIIGYDMEDVIKATYFWLDTNEDISIVRKMCDLKDEYDGKSTWTENAFNEITNCKCGVLDVDGVRAYYEQGLTADDIMTANILCRKGVYTITEILDKKLAGQSFEEIKGEIAANVSGIASISLSLFETNVLEKYSNDDNPDEHDKLNETEERVLESLRDRGIYKEMLSESEMIEELKKRVGAEGISAEKVERLTELGYDCKTILKAAQTSNKTGESFDACLEEAEGQA